MEGFLPTVVFSPVEEHQGLLCPIAVLSHQLSGGDSPSDHPEHPSNHPDGFLFPQFSDYQNYLVNSCVKENPTMERSIALCNGISQWVQLMVLSRPTPQLRAEVFIKFIQVAQVGDGGSIWPEL